MSTQISNTNLQHILDKAARWATEANGDAIPTAITLGSPYAVSSPSGWGISVANSDVLGALLTLVETFTDSFQLIDLLSPAANLNAYQPVFPSQFYSVWSAVIAGLNTQGGRYNNAAPGDLSGLDTMLRVINASAPTLRASSQFATYFGGLSQNNVFATTPFTLATISVTGATTATLTPSATALPYASGQIALLNTKSEGLTSTTISVQGTKSGTSTASSVTVATTTNNQLTAFGDTTKLWTAITALNSISGGFNGDTFSVVIIPDRLINAA